MPTLDEVTMAAESTRLRRGARTSDVRSQWCEACREAHVWCDVCGSLSCRHVPEATTVRRATEIWHRPRFDVDEDALPLGVEILSLAAIDLLG
jgi:hypothetical protein